MTAGRLFDLVFGVALSFAMAAVALWIGTVAVYFIGHELDRLAWRVVGLLMRRA